MEITVQVNGRLCTTIDMPYNSGTNEIKLRVLNNDMVRKAISTKTVRSVSVIRRYQSNGVVLVNVVVPD